MGSGDETSTSSQKGGTTTLQKTIDKTHTHANINPSRLYDARWSNLCYCNKLLCKDLHIYSETTVFVQAPNHDA